MGPAKVFGVDYPGTFKNGPHSMVEWLAQVLTPERAALKCIVFEDEVMTFAEVQKAVDTLASALANHYGVKKGDRVAICMRNFPEWCVAFLAGHRIGAVLVPMNSWWKEGEMEYGLSDSGTKVLFVDRERLAQSVGPAKKLNVQLVAVRVSDADVKKAQQVASGLVTPYADVMAAGATAAPPPMPEIATDDDANIMYTSGTTGNPKGVIQTHRGITTQLRISSLSGAIGLKVATAKGLFKPGMAMPQPGAIVAVPLFHVTGLYHLFLTALNGGGKCILMAKWDAGRALELIERERPTGWTGVPTMVADMMAHPDFAKRDTSSLMSVGGGGAATPTSQVKEASKKFSGQVSQGWGLTETNGALAINVGEDYLRKPGSTGKCFPTVEMLTIDVDSKKPLPIGAEGGELVCKTPLNMRGYWNKAEASAAALIEVPGKGPGWFRTGDVGIIDEEGFITITGRAKDIIIRGGENISCVEVEEAFFATGEVFEAAAFSVPDERLGEVVGLAVMVKEGSSATSADLVAKVVASKKLADYKTPKPQHVFVQRDPLTRGATGKILRREIKEACLKPKSKL